MKMQFFATRNGYTATITKLKDGGAKLIVRCLGYECHREMFDNVWSAKSRLVELDDRFFTTRGWVED